MSCMVMNLPILAVSHHKCESVYITLTCMLPDLYKLPIVAKCPYWVV
mgnify:FL=1